MAKNKIGTTAVIVSFDEVSGDVPLMLVGKQVNGNVEIINAISGDEARELYDRLTTPTEAIAEEGVG